MGRSRGRVRVQAAAMPARGAAIALARRHWTVDQINAINLGLMLVSAAIAWVVPFELLLISYAVLGPLHYLTEISWLHDRAYFTTGRYDAAALVVLGGLGFLANYTALVPWKGWAILALAVSVAFAFAADRRIKLTLLVAGMVATIAFQYWRAGWLFLFLLLPTVIHVYVFTGLFILHGNLKSHSRWGYASLAVFLACGAALVLYRPPAAAYAISERTGALANEFSGVVEQLTTSFGIPFDWDNVAAIGRFLAFAYTYHYLNWFSKTEIIGWHAVSRARLTVIGVVYAAALGLYAYDYHVGFVALFGLSFTHVLLELPLDLRTAVALTGRSLPAR
jgi:hypothetical protein